MPSRTSSFRLGLALSFLSTACADDQLPPLPEALIVVDTDAPVPKLVDRLRVDFYRSDGTWFDSRDLPRRDPRDWPASFSVYEESEGQGRTLLVRLRAYREDSVRDYRGERFMERPLPGDPAEVVGLPAPPEGEVPRLVRDGRDVTPRTEPVPSLAIDRLVRVVLTPGVRASVRVTLRGACFGTMADFQDRTTCIDTENIRVPVHTEPRSDDLTVPRASTLVNRFAAPIACTRSPQAHEVCVPGGVFALGSSDVTGLAFYDAMTSIPERIAIIPPLLVDRYEVTVARWREARNAGFEHPFDPQRNDADAPFSQSGPPPFPGWCTYSYEPLPMHSRESYPVNCLQWQDARSFCQFHGADLLTEAQWEFVASATGDFRDTFYPWGNEPPSCDAQVFYREKPGDLCARFGIGPAASGAGIGDVTPLGVHDLGGSLFEWTLDSPRPFDALCWLSLGAEDPRCWEENTTKRSIRGGAWRTVASGLLSSLRPRPLTATFLYEEVGFRCARPGVEPP